MTIPPAPPIPIMTAEPLPDSIDRGEEGEQCGTCKFCHGPVFLDFIDTDCETGEQIFDDSCYWQHNDDRYTPGRPSPCGPMEGWASRRD